MFALGLNVDNINPLDLVGVPCAVAVKQVLNGTIAEKGVLAPMNSKINDPLIKELKEVSQLSKHRFNSDMLICIF